MKVKRSSDEIKAAVYQYGSITVAAEELGYSRSQIQRVMHKLGIYGKVEPRIPDETVVELVKQNGINKTARILGYSSRTIARRMKRLGYSRTIQINWNATLQPVHTISKKEQEMLQLGQPPDIAGD